MSSLGAVSGIQQRGGFTRILAFAKKGGFALMDQALFSGANFLLNILLARFLEPAQYGAYAVVFTWFLLLGTIHTATLTEPILVYGSGKYAERFSRYLGYTLFGHIGVSALISAILAVIAVIFFGLRINDIGIAFLGVALAAPFILLNWFLRRVSYVRSQTHWAAMCGALYLTLQLIMIFLLAVGYTETFPTMGVVGVENFLHYSPLSSFTAFLTMGISSLISCSVLIMIFKPRFTGHEEGISADAVVRDHVKYGRWAVATMMARWIPNNLYLGLLIPVVLSLGSAGAYRALTNFVMPIWIVNDAISILLIPSFVRLLRGGDRTLFEHRVWLTVGIYVFISTAYALLIVVLGANVIMPLVYGDNYREYAELLVLVGFLPLTNCASVILGGVLRAMNLPQLVFRTDIVRGVSLMTVGVFLLFNFGIVGALLGSAVAGVVETVVNVWAFQRNKNRTVSYSSGETQESPMIVEGA